MDLWELSAGSTLQDEPQTEILMESSPPSRMSLMRPYHETQGVRSMKTSSTVLNRLFAWLALPYLLLPGLVCAQTAPACHLS